MKEYCIFKVENDKLIIEDLSQLQAKKIKTELNDTYGMMSYDVGITKHYKK